jgi:hypothetical protein
MADHRVGLLSESTLVETMVCLDTTTFSGVRETRTPEKTVEIDL